MNDLDNLQHRYAGLSPSASATPITALKLRSGVKLIAAASLKPEPIRWLWPGWLARGKLHVLAGAPGTGKTTLAMYLAACISAGKAFPDGSRPDPGGVLIWSGEDDFTDTLVPRLVAAGADRNAILFVGDVSEDRKRYPFDPARDVDQLKAAVVGNVSLIIIDPLVSAVSQDSHKNAEVRRSLAPLVDLAQRLDAALLGITHYSKGTQGKEPLERVTGSLAFGALARIVMGTIRQQSEDDAPQKMMLARAKSNIGPDGGGFSYAFEQTEIEGGISASRILWGAAVEGSARDLLAESDAEGDIEQRDAADWLQKLLKDKPLPVGEVKRHADEAGFKWRTVQRAMRKAGVKSHREGFGKPASWSLITHSRATVAPVTPLSECGANGESGANGDSLGSCLDTDLTEGEL